MKRFFLRLILCTVCCLAITGHAQQKLYPHLFNLNQVTLEDDLFRHAMVLNDSVLLAYDVDRLMTPYFRQAGDTLWAAQHPNFDNWGSGNFRLDGHVGGHYMSALALAWAASDDRAMKKALKKRLDYMVDRMAACQAVFDHNTDGLYGYIGGLPDNNVWTGLYRGDTRAFDRNRGNVPFYVMHKIYEGFLNAWVYAGNKKALQCFIKLCDWGVNLIANLDDATLQRILDTEHGGICEVYADAFRLTGDERYLLAAQRFTHRTMVEGMQTGNVRFLDGRHANTQVPKYVGFTRIAQELAAHPAGALFRAGDLHRAAENFWQDVTMNRTVAIGGNSVNEHFLREREATRYIEQNDGPESCNTYNMLKLTTDLFADHHRAAYADFYEKAMYNHILSTQHPHTGGYVYFTSLRPQHYRVYSQVNEGMWCCVGTGMENHSKYGMFIYAQDAARDTLFVNLFVSSTLRDKRFVVHQTTRFPYEEGTSLTVGKSGNYTLAVRHPAWCTEGYSISINGGPAIGDNRNGSYVCITRAWKKGDRIDIRMPMKPAVETCPLNPDYIAVKYGPVLLAAATETADLTGLFAGEGRWDHEARGPQRPLESAPMFKGGVELLFNSMHCTDPDQLHFSIDPPAWQNPESASLVLQPFFKIHEARYMIYWKMNWR
ncbi:MAG: glycoside hydrolase family 127 protein [Bacteroidales bacterium]|nr:glycoside hydrolase family 127 protein [Bacteroidales bacterium]